MKMFFFLVAMLAATSPAVASSSSFTYTLTNDTSYNVLASMNKPFYKPATLSYTVNKKAGTKRTVTLKPNDVLSITIGGNHASATLFMKAVDTADGKTCVYTTKPTIMMAKKASVKISNELNKVNCHKAIAKSQQ